MAASIGPQAGKLLCSLHDHLQSSCYPGSLGLVGGDKWVGGHITVNNKKRKEKIFQNIVTSKICRKTVTLNRAEAY